MNLSLAEHHDNNLNDIRQDLGKLVIRRVARELRLRHDRYVEIADARNVDQKLKLMYRLCESDREDGDYERREGDIDIIFELLRIFL